VLALFAILVLSLTVKCAVPRLFEAEAALFSDKGLFWEFLFVFRVRLVLIPDFF